MSFEDIITTPSQIGYQLEQLIHNELSRIQNVTCYRENEIIEEFKDQTLNGVDHWITNGYIHVFIQDKWKEINTQPEIAQFLICVERLKALICNSAAGLPSFYCIWVSKSSPTSFALKLLEEKHTIIIVNSKSIQSLARETYWRVGDLFDDIENKPIISVYPSVKEKKNLYDNTDDGKVLFDQFILVCNEINDLFKKVIHIINICGGELRLAIIHLIPETLEKWTDFKKIDYNAILRSSKKICVPTKTNRIMSHCMEYYSKLRAFSVSLSHPILKYNQIRDKLKENKSIKIKQFPDVKCQAEPMTQSEFTASIQYTNGYYKGMEFNFGSYYYNI